MKRLVLLGMILIPFSAHASSFMMLDSTGNSPNLGRYYPTMNACLAEADARNNVIGRTVFKCMMVNDGYSRKSRSEEHYKYRPPHYYLHHPYEEKTKRSHY